MLHIYSRVVASCTLLLIVAGAMVTSTGSGLAVPDWPTSYGYNMFTFPLSSMVGGIFYEHGHRLIASTVGFLTIILAVWLWLREPRRWLKVLGFGALAAVILQGVLGGITVLFFLPATVSIGHAGLAQIFFCLTVSIALFTSRGWLAAYGGIPNDPTLRRLTVATTAAIYVQVLLGATMRHTDAGLAIPDFPLAFGRLVPPYWDSGIAIHYAHRVGAIVVTIGILVTAARVWRLHRSFGAFVRPATLLVCLVAVQIALGALVVLTGKAVIINSAHVATGALVLVTSLVFTLRAHRLLFTVTTPATRQVPGSDVTVPARLKPRAT